jgi:hypothetical protein
MRRRRSQTKVARYVGLGLALVAGAATATEAGDPELPKRRPGLWRITTISPDAGRQTSEACISETDSIAGPVLAGCAAPTVLHAKDQTVVTIDCSHGPTHDVTSLLFTGDYRNWYRGQARITAGARRAGFTIDAKFLTERCGGEPR